MKKFFLLVAFCASLFSEDLFVQEKTGNVLIGRNGIWKELPQGIFISTGSSIITKEDSSVSLLTAGNHTIKIGPESVFTARLNSPELKDIELWLGEISASVKPLPPSEKFQVKTPAAVCAVRGTDFTVLATNNKTEVEVREGIVGVMTEESEEVFVEKGQSLTVEKGKAPGKPVPIEEKKKEKPKKEKPKKAEKQAEPEITYKEEAHAAKPSAGSRVDMNGTIGAVALTDPKTGETKVYYEFSAFPEITIGKLGIGLDLVVHFDEQNQIKEDEWDEWSDAYSKIDYIRWGRKQEDPFYILLGRFRRGITIGHGFIVNNYTNMAQFPNVRKAGLEMGLDLKKWGFEGMVGDLQWREVFASRLYFRPLLGTGIPLFKNLKIAGSFGADIDPDSHSSTKDDEVVVVGADAELPILTYKLFSATIFSDWAKMVLGSTYTETTTSYNLEDGGEGISYGLSGNFLFLKYRGEYRRIENNFIPGYFDAHYDVERYRLYDTAVDTMTKAAYYLQGKTKEPILAGPYVEAWFNIFNLLDFSASWENYNVGRDDPFYPHLIANAQLASVPGLSQYTLEAEYDKKSARRWKDIRKTDENAILALKVGYNVAPNVTMFVTIRRNYDADGNMTKSMMAETRMRF